MTVSPKLSQKSILPVVLNSFRSIVPNVAMGLLYVLPDESAYLFPRVGKVSISFGITLSKVFSLNIQSDQQYYTDLYFVAMNRVKFRSNIWSYDSSLIHCISHSLFYKGSPIVSGGLGNSHLMDLLYPYSHVFKV